MAGERMLPLAGSLGPPEVSKFRLTYPSIRDAGRPWSKLGQPRWISGIAERLDRPSAQNGSWWSLSGVLPGCRSVGVADQFSRSVLPETSTARTAWPLPSA